MAPDCLQLGLVKLVAQLTEFGRVRERQRHLAGVGQHVGSESGYARDCRASDLLAALPAISGGYDPPRSVGVPLT